MAASEETITTPSGQEVTLKGKVASPWWTRAAAIVGIITFVGVAISYNADRGDRASADDVTHGQELTQAQNVCRSEIAARFDAVVQRSERLNDEAATENQDQLRALIRAAAADQPIPPLDTPEYQALDQQRKDALTAAAALEQHPRDEVAAHGWSVPPDIVTKSGGLLPNRFDPCPHTLADLHDHGGSS